MLHIKLQANEFTTFVKLIFDEVGITLADSKHTMVESRLHKRVVHYQLESFAQYLRIVQITPKEKIAMINLITTNETYFFREQAHYDFIEGILKEYPRDKTFRIWSAASSVGAEAYSLAMICESLLNSKNWEIYGSDINTEVVKKARMGLYPQAWADKIPETYKKAYCLKGSGKYEGQFIVDRSFSKKMHFFENNLLEYNANIGSFDVIFLRNVLLYFNEQTKKTVIENCIKNLRVGGFFIISLTENFNTIKIDNLQHIQTSIYQKTKA